MLWKSIFGAQLGNFCSVYFVFGLLPQWCNLVSLAKECDNQGKRKTTALLICYSSPKIILCRKSGHIFLLKSSQEVTKMSQDVSCGLIERQISVMKCWTEPKLLRSYLTRFWERRLSWSWAWSIWELQYSWCMKHFWLRMGPDISKELCRALGFYSISFMECFLPNYQCKLVDNEEFAAWVVPDFQGSLLLSFTFTFIPASEQKPVQAHVLLTLKT